MLIDNEIKLGFQDVMLRPKRSTLESRSQVNLVKTFNPKYGTQFTGIPIIASNMATGTFKMLDVFSKSNLFVAIAKYNSSKWMEDIISDNNIKYGLYTIGMNDSELNQFKLYYDHINKINPASINNIKLCIDIANGYTEKFGNYISKIREQFPNMVLIAGNVVTADMTEQLIISGADYVKIGISQGSECITALKTGVGYPQLSAIIECADAAHGLGAGIIADGGIRNAGDAGKAFCANADFIMIGGMFAGTDECDGNIISRYYRTGEMIADDYTEGFPASFHYVTEEKKFKLFYGMSSEYAQDQHMGGMKKYRTSEGRSEEIPYIGSVQSVVDDILGGLRSTGTYIGANDIKNFGKCATFIRVNRLHDKF